MSYEPSPAARAGSEHYNALPFDQRAILAPLLEHYRQLGLAEALDASNDMSRALAAHIGRIREAGKR